VRVVGEGERGRERDTCRKGEREGEMERVGGGQGVGGREEAVGEREVEIERENLLYPFCHLNEKRRDTCKSSWLSLTEKRLVQELDT
jgi:hypothetical protein